VSTPVRLPLTGPILIFFFYLFLKFCSNPTTPRKIVRVMSKCSFACSLSLDMVLSLRGVVVEIRWGFKSGGVFDSGSGVPNHTIRVRLPYRLSSDDVPLCQDGS
jgi:hypothetical protein